MKRLKAANVNVAPPTLKMHEKNLFKLCKSYFPGIKRFESCAFSTTSNSLELNYKGNCFILHYQHERGVILSASIPFVELTEHYNYWVSDATLRAFKLI